MHSMLGGSLLSSDERRDLGVGDAAGPKAQTLSR